MTDLFKAKDDAPNTSGGDPVAALVGADKKFKTVEDLARGKLEADAFIEQLKREAAEMRDALERSQSATDTNETLKAMLEQLAASKENESDNPAPAFSPEELSKLVEAKVNEIDQSRGRRANRERANAELLKRFNNNTETARKYVEEQAQRLSMTVEQLGEMAETSPEAYTRLLGIAPTPKPSASPLSVRSAGPINDEPSQVRNAEYYRQLRKQLGPKFYDPKIQQQRMRDAEALGESYFNT